MGDTRSFFSGGTEHKALLLQKADTGHKALLLQKADTGHKALHF